MDGATARSGAEETQCYLQIRQRRKGLHMKWHTMNIYLKVTTLMGALAALILAAGAEGKWY